MPLKTLSFDEFKQRGAYAEARRRGMSSRDAYKNYLGFIAKRRSGRARQMADPFAPVSEQDLGGRVSAAVRGQIDPLLAEITREADTRAQAIQRETAARSQYMMPFRDRTADIYRHAQLASAGVGDVLASTMRAEGGEQAGSLKGALEAIGAPANLVSEVAGGAQQFATGAANAGLATQSGFVNELLGRGAEATNFAGLLPAFAQMEGARDISQGRYEADEEIRQLRGKIPGLTQELLATERDRELQKAIARAGLVQDQQELAYESGQPDNALSKSLGMLVDSNGTPVLRNGQIVPLTGPGTPGGAANTAKAKADAKAQAARTAAVGKRSAALTASEKAARSLARTLFKGEKVTTGGGLVPGQTQVKRPAWAVAFRQVYNEIAGPLERQYGLKRDRINEIVKQALVDAGFKPPHRLRGYPR